MNSGSSATELSDTGEFWDIDGVTFNGTNLDQGTYEVTQSPASGDFDFHSQDAGPTHGGGIVMAGQVALIILAVWVGLNLLSLFFSGVVMVLRFLFAIIAFPFRVVGFVFRQLWRIPRGIARVFGFGRPVARKVTQTAGAAYTKVAEGWNNQEANGWPAFKNARETLKTESEHVAEAVGAARAKWQEKRKDFHGQRERRHEQKDHLREQKRLLKKLGPREYMRVVVAGGGAAVKEAAEHVKEAAENVTGFATSGGKVKPHTFPGYRVIKEMPRGGSGAHLFLAHPKGEHKREMAGRGIELPSKVVIKSFSLMSGAHMTGILREGRALDAARQLGQVLEHNSGDDGMYYVMPFVPGDTLDVYIANLHKLANGSFPTPEELKTELKSKQLDSVLGLGLDLISELERFHDHGLWHKDIKPGNLIVNQDRLHIVDLGLLTPLASALTLTTHGTEYFRDPEMVRLAMSGAQVRDVDAVKFDLYSAGAVLFSMLEGTFPAHGNLSRLQRPCPPALAWVVRRAMSEHDSRYPSASMMRADLAFLCNAKNVQKVKPVQLPSWGAEPEEAAQPLVAAKHASPEPEVLAEKVVQQPVKKIRRSFTAVIPKKAAAAALIAVALLGAVVSNESNRPTMTDAFSGDVVSGDADSGAPFTVETSMAGIIPVVVIRKGVVEAAGEIGETIVEKMNSIQDDIRLSLPFLKETTEQVWAAQRNRFVAALKAEVPTDALKAVYVYGAELNPLAQRLNTQLKAQLIQDGVSVLPEEGDTSVEMSARIATMLDTLDPGQEPQLDDQLRFFMDHGEVQAVAHLVETQDGIQAHWIVNPMADQ